MSPRTWGWTEGRDLTADESTDVPTHVGVDRQAGQAAGPLERCPHARGGGPGAVRVGDTVWRMSPRTWGWTDGAVVEGPQELDVPTHVGVDRRRSPSGIARRRCPHARGGGPPVWTDDGLCVEMSPRTWGWTTRLIGRPTESDDVPTHVGVDPQDRISVVLSL